MIISKINKKILLLLYLSLISQILTVTELKLNETHTGEMKKDESFEYFTLTIPSNTEREKFILIFEVKENKKNILEGEEIFSDPDIYVSKTEKNPRSPETSDYYSERYGNDILSIPKSEISPNEKFYIGMYCQFKCKYKLKAYLSEEIEINIGKMYSIEMNKKSVLNYVIKVPDENYNELNVIATSNDLEEFKIFMNQNNPSSQNTYKFIPTWASGYMFNIQKNTREYCKDCLYHIILQCGKKDCSIQLFAYFQNSITNVLPGSPVQDAMRTKGKRCYSFNIYDLSNSEKPKIVISTSLFSGSGILVIEGFKHDEYLDYDKAKKHNFGYEILGEKSILIDENDLKNFETNTNDEEKKLYYCIFSKVSMSYIITTYYLNQAHTLQDFNFILPKTEVTGFLLNEQFTKYQIADFSSVSKDKESDITIDFTALVGFPKAYAFFCLEDECYFDKNYFNEKKRNNNLIESVFTSYQDSIITIEGKENKCYKNEDCELFVVVQCIAEKKGYCHFKISANIEENALLMSPRQSYYSIISVNKTDNYQINIIDSDIESIVIVLNTASGDADMKVYLKTEYDKKQIGFSSNNDYIPDVVRITPKRLNKENLIGDYLVEVTSTTFSSYHLYYYTTYKVDKEDDDYEENEPDDDDVTLTLSEGVMITDYFPNDIDYKIYTYQPNLEERENLKFVITPVNVKFSFKVFLDLDNFEYDDDTNISPHERIKGFDWVSDINGELIIKEDDDKLDLDSTYYIVVYMDNPEDNLLLEKSVMKYYIGVTTPSIPFILYDGVEQISTLSNDYPIQTFWFLHTDIKTPFEVDINSLYGQVDIYVDVDEITEEKIEKNEKDENYDEEYEEEDYKKTSLVYARKIKDYDTITLSTSYLNEYCSGDIEEDDDFYGCRIYIYVKRSKHTIKAEKSSQFLIVARSNEKKGEFLTSGTSKSDFITPGEYHYYIIEEIRKRKGSAISVSFTNGIGELYLRIPEKPEYGDDIIFPNEKNYTLKGNATYNGRIIYIPEEYFQKLNNEHFKIQFFITVKGENHGYINEEEEDDDSYIEYTISYTSDKRKINQNIPYEDFINAGEHKYFDLFFDDTVKNIYISLSNMNGDADMYLNYGDKNPSTRNYNWKSTGVGHEYIDFNIEHTFFKKNNIKTLEGHYSLLVIGFTATSYTLFVSSHENKVLPLRDNSPMTCECQKEDDKCYFRYDDIYVEKGEDEENEGAEVVFTLNYIYGGGVLFSKTVKDSQLNDVPKGKKVYDIFPGGSDYEYSTVTSNQLYYLKVDVKDTNYNKDTIILLTYICQTSTLVDINSAKLSYEPVYDSLDINRENIYFLKFNDDYSQRKQPYSLITFYNSDNNNIIYNIHTYVGQGRIEIYTNESYYDEKQKTIKYDYNAIGDIIIGNEDLDSKEQEQFSNYIENTKNIQKKTIFFKVQPMTDFGFYIQLLYNNSWQSVPIGRSKEFFIKWDKMIGYFDIYDEFDGVEFTLTLDNVNNKKATVYIKINELDKKEDYDLDEKSAETAYKYSLPTEKNYDYKASTDSGLGLLSIDVNNLPKIKDNENKFIRALFLVQIKNERKFFIRQYDDDYYTHESTVHILINPSQNYVKRVDAKPFEIFYSNESVVYDRRGKLQSISEKIYALEKRYKDDDTMIIELSSCRGEMNIKLSSFYNMSEENIDYEEPEEEYGRKMIIINNLKHKHIYLSIKPSETSEECEDANIQCKTRLIYLMYYYSTTQANFEISSVNETLEYQTLGRGKIKLIIPKISSRNIWGDYRDFQEYKFDLFITTNEERFSSMGSVCYLTRYIDEVDPSKRFRDIKLVNNKEYTTPNLDYRETYYINILARNPTSGEIITFNPIEVVNGGYFPWPLWQSFLYYIIIAFVCAGIGYLIKQIYVKYTNSGYSPVVSNDFGRNDGYERADAYQRPNVNIEMPNVKKGEFSSDKVKYANLSEDETKL